MTGEPYSNRVERLYHQIKAIAISAMQGERVGHTLQPTAVANEAYLRLAQHKGEWGSDEQFLRAVVTTVRRVLIDHARTKKRMKRGGFWTRVEISQEDGATNPRLLDLLILDELLNALAERDRDAAFVMEASIFGGLSDETIALMMETDKRRVQLNRRRGRAWLIMQLQEGPVNDG